MTLDTQILSKIANTIRGLSIDAINQANSGHPGLPLGCAELGAYLYTHGLTHNPKSPEWENRDRFVLSAGHGSMLQYACLHLSGFDVSLDDIKSFRQLHSPTAGHPEYRELPGVETTTGPLGQGIATAVGLALGQKIVNAQYGVPLDNHTIVLAGDGCIMEGISSEASSFAGHLKLDNLIVIYDSNDICLDGPISECLSEDVKKRYESYGWNVVKIDGHNFNDIHKAVQDAKNSDKPTLIEAKTVIGKGSPNKAGSSSVHGSPLGQEEGLLTKQALGLPETSFYVPEEVKDFFSTLLQEQQRAHDEWKTTYAAWSKENKDKAAAYEASANRALSKEANETLKNLELPEGKATRALSNSVIQAIAEACPFIIGGSADLSCSDSTAIKSSGAITADNFNERNIKYGVREFAMGAIASGLYLQGNIKPFVGTFLTFSDYMKNAIRLAALMNLGVVYQFTHDSILLGEDGPTHQPVEHLASLRSIPNLTVIRPADGTEVKAAWKTALESENPVALILSRQGLPELNTSSFEDAQKGAYIVKKESKDTLDHCIIATGSEVSLALDVAEQLETDGQSVRVVSMPSMELFDKQDKTYQNAILPETVRKYSVIEAQSSFGWHKYIGKDCVTFTVDSFGLSAPGNALKEEFGFTTAHITQTLKKELINA
jgi:transketolase